MNELRDIVGHKKPAILGITESKLDSSVSDREVNMNSYSIVRSDRKRNDVGVSCCIRANLFSNFNCRNIF